MAPTLANAIRGIITPANLETRGVRGPPDGPLAEAFRLFVRKDDDKDKDDYKGPDPSSGVLDPHDISNVGFFVLFALIGVGFIVAGIWFFFWAKNGGFYFKDNDWDDYKTTVMRRKGPNGTLLSGATPSTNLGGGSVYKDVAEDDNTTVVTESTALSGVTAGASDIGAREKRRKKQDKRDREKRKQRSEKQAQRHVGNNGVEDDVAEHDAQKELRSYRHERPARVGGLNKQSDASAFDGSTNHSQTQGSTEASGSTVESELLANRQSTPTSTPTGTPTKKREERATPAIRKVYSTADRTADRTAERETERIRAEARRLREEGRTSRRDFSYQRGGAAESALSESLLESSVDGSDLGTKSYHHPMPELREQRQRDREERRARRGGYRRGRGEDDGL